MTTSKAYNIVNTEIVELLVAAGLREGESLNGLEISATNVPLFWNIAIKDKAYSSKETYLTWNLISLEPVGNADDKVKAREGFITLDLFTKRRVTSSSIELIIENIDIEAIKKGWQLELSGPPEYDSDLKCNHISFDLTKKLFD